MTPDRPGPEGGERGAFVSADREDVRVTLDQFALYALPEADRVRLALAESDDVDDPRGESSYWVAPARLAAAELDRAGRLPAGNPGPLTPEEMNLAATALEYICTYALERSQKFKELASKLRSLASTGKGS